MSDKVKVYITKYALTQGIYEVEAEINQSISLATVSNKERLHQYFHKGEWFTRKADAQAKAEQMRQRKLASLRKQIKDLEQLKFN